MIEGLNIEAWLQERSGRVERIDDMLVYEHFTGERSVLVLRSDGWRDGILPANASALKPFYNHYCGASFGDSHIIIASNIDGGIDREFIKLPDLHEMRHQALELGFYDDPMEEVFMAEAAWMFIYSYRLDFENAALNRFDRELMKKRTMRSFQSVLNEWWSIVLEDPIT